MNVFRCPRCGKGRLYRNLLDMHERCSECGLTFKSRETGDGPAFFGILIVGALTAIGAAVVEIKYAPPFWVHAMIWIPFVVIGSVLSLRYLKAELLAMQYRINPEDFQ